MKSSPMSMNLDMLTTLASLPQGGLTAQLAPVCDEYGDVAIEDWDTLLIAVKARLTAVVSGHDDQNCGTLSSGVPCVVQASVRECVSALHQLHLTYTHEQARRQHLERELHSVRMQLAQTLAERAETHADK